MTDPASFDFSRFRLEETYKSLTGLGTEVLKALILVNGAAAAGNIPLSGQF
jgi:hypothetical protein